MFIAGLWTIAKTWNQPKCPSMIDWIKKMWYIHTMEYYAAIKSNEIVFLDEPGEHHSQQTDTRTENEIPHVLTHKRVLNHENTWTQGGEHYTLGSVGGNRRGTAGFGELGRDRMGRNARYRWRGGRQQITLPRVYLCNYLACSSHVPQNLKCNKKIIIKKEGNTEWKGTSCYNPGRRVCQNWFFIPKDGIKL